MTRGPWIERLEAIAVSRELVAVAGRRDAVGVTTSRVHVVPITLLDGKGTGWSLDAGATVRALAFAGDDLLLSGGDDGRLLAWDVTGQKILMVLALGAAIHSIAIDTNVARGSAGTICVGTADGTAHIIRFTIANATPAFAGTAKHKLSDGPITALAYDPAGLWVAGGADGQLRVIGAEVRALSPGGDGGIRAVVCMGDGRAAIGCGDGSIRTLFVVGDVEAYDRSGDHGHQGAVRALALGPVIVDDAGREQPRRVFSAGEDGAIKSWFIDGARRPKTIEVGIGALTAMVFVAGPVPKVDKAQGRLWTCSTNRKVATLVVGADADVAESAQKLGSNLD
jgi:WD40 repeat protein